MAMNWAGLVLAGGGSRRMGSDKAALILAGKSLLTRAREQLQRCNCDPFTVGGGSADLGDRPGVAGPLAGLAGAIDQLANRYQGMVVIPVDMPLLPDGAIGQLRARFSNDNPYLGYADSLFPLALRLDRHLQETIDGLVGHQGRQASIQALLQAVGANLLPISEPWQSRFINCNNPAQWQAIVASQPQDLDHP